ncbi:SMI1/KNR4 family protein [Streptomyces brevispora]|uniref:Cell wall assembly regulator SMI1 n=1 Tax=Streptomyces brevispora TaxID=887462 RepID=A0A561TUS0_9ACTN|nr:SMI1/KNR4 family protein [Streptomyces brevispora]TWF90860.1 cell wall assembly regulator SMI1 [Streptomyces brevispora]WSC11612.1 SMI1/KNR4 family protein [Streptomyces brevispora]
MTSIDHSRVRQSWDRIGLWLRTHVRQAPLRPAVDSGRLDAVEAAQAVTLPADVKEWWALADVSADFWIPGDFAPVALEEALETRETWLLVAEEEGPLFDQNGEPEPRFLPEFIPIAMSPGGDGLIVDLRPGGANGAVFLWDHERWGLGVPLWDSIDSMLQDIADALESQTAVLGQHAALGGAEATCVGQLGDAGELNWEPVPVA